MYIKVNQSQIKQYPYLLEYLYQEFPNTAFARSIDSETLAAYGVYPVTLTSPPEINPLAEKCSEGTPQLISGIWVQTWHVEPLDPEKIMALLAERRMTLLLRIDTDANQIYSDVMGTRATEYIEADNQAQAYKDAGYTGEVGEMVAAWAVAKEQTAQWAADDILEKAAQWRQAQAVIRTQRLIHKQQAKAAMTHSALDDVTASWVVFIDTIRTELADALTP